MSNLVWKRRYQSNDRAREAITAQLDIERSWVSLGAHEDRWVVQIMVTASHLWIGVVRSILSDVNKPRHNIEPTIENKLPDSRCS